MASRSRFVIQPSLMHNHIMNEDEATRNVQHIMDAIDQVFDGERNSIEWEELYRRAYNSVLHQYGNKLYTALKAKFRERAPVCVRRQQFELAAIIARDICMYLDRTWVVTMRKASIYEIGMGIYAERVAYRAAAKEHWRRHALIVGKFAQALKDLYTEVTFRPHNSGAKRTRDEFEATARVHDAA